MNSLQGWADNNEPLDKMLWKQGYWDQIIFVRDKIASIFASCYEEYIEIRENIRVISTHMSKSITLPVYKVFTLDGIKLTIRYNFFNWKVSVDSLVDIDCDFGNLFNPEEKIKPIYCEGFKNEWVFDSYKNNKKQFTVEIQTKYELFTFLWLIAYSLRKEN